MHLEDFQKNGYGFLTQKIQVLKCLLKQQLLNHNIEIKELHKVFNSKEAVYKKTIEDLGCALGRFNCS